MNRSVISTLSEGWFKKIEKEPTKGEEPPDIKDRTSNILNKTQSIATNLKSNLAEKMMTIKDRLKKRGISL